MKKPRFRESQIFQVLKEAEAGVPIAELCRKHGMSNASFYKWRAKYGGMDVSSRKRIHNPTSTRTLLKNSWHGLRRALVQEWTDMNCTVTSANNFSAQSGIISRISPVQSAVSVRKSTLDRPFIFPILSRQVSDRPLTT